MCKALVCFVYDPEGQTPNPRAVETDLSEPEGELPSIVLSARCSIAPCLIGWVSLLCFDLVNFGCSVEWWEHECRQSRTTQARTEELSPIRVHVEIAVDASEYASLFIREVGRSLKVVVHDELRFYKDIRFTTFA